MSIGSKLCTAMNQRSVILDEGRETFEITGGSGGIRNAYEMVCLGCEYIGV